MNQIGFTKYYVYIDREDKYKEIGVLNLLAETAGFEVSKHKLEKPWVPPFIPPRKEKRVPLYV